MLIADCGTVWTKIKDLSSNSNSVVKTQELFKDGGYYFHWSTGHMGKNASENYENELVSLAAGSLENIKESDFTVVDVGGRDIKYCCFNGRKLVRMNWNQSCGATTGFILDLISKYYKINYNDLITADRIPDVTCGVLGIERVFDDIVKGMSENEAVARLVLGIAQNIYVFAEKPDKIHLSGGLCENRCFVESLKKFTDVVLMGRYVLTDGLAVLSSRKNNILARVR